MIPKTPISSKSRQNKNEILTNIADKKRISSNKGNERNTSFEKRLKKKGELSKIREENR